MADKCKTVSQLAGNVAREDVRALIADALHQRREHIAPLAEVVYEKTAGNPFFMNVCLKPVTTSAPPNRILSAATTAMLVGMGRRFIAFGILAQAKRRRRQRLSQAGFDSRLTSAARYADLHIAARLGCRSWPSTGKPCSDGMVLGLARQIETTADWKAKHPDCLDRPS